MKNSKKNGANAVSKNQKTDIRENAVEILKVLLGMEKRYGMNTLVGVLKGMDEHRKDFGKFEGFGLFSEKSFVEIKNYINVLINEGLIGPADKFANTLKISDAGKDFLDSNEKLEVWPSALKESDNRKLLEFKLRRWRYEEAQKTGKPAYRVLSDFSLHRIVWENPASEEEFREIPGIGLFRSENYGPIWLGILREVEEEKAKVRQEMLRKRVQSPSYQQTKALFEQGLSMADIAAEKGVKESTIRTYLSEMHQVGEVDLRPWIEENIDSKQLYKGSEYFRQTENPRLKEAYEVLGLDYDTLRYCKLYVSDVSTEYHSIAV